MERFKHIIEKEWIVQSTEATQFLFYPPAIASVETLWARFSLGHNYIVSFVKDNYGYWFYAASDVKQLTKHIVQAEKKQPGLIQSLIAEWKKDEKKFQDACRAVDKFDLSTLSDDELAKHFDTLFRAYLNEWGLPIMADAFSLYSETLITELLMPLLKKRGEAKLFSRYLPILTAPVEPSFASEETGDFLHLVKRAKESTKIMEALSLPAKKRMEALQAHQSFLRDIKQHSKKYFWIQNSYLRGDYLDEGFFADKIAKGMKEKIDIDAEIARIQSAPQKALEEKKKLSEELGIGDDLLLLLQLVEKFAMWQDGRKKNNLIGNYYMMLFLDEFCRRKGYRKEDWVALIQPEFRDALAGKINPKAMAERSKCSMCIHTRSGLEILTGKEAQELFDALQEETHKEVSDVRGSCASQGRTEGTVRIVMATKDIPKMKQGDILVSSMTRPELVPAMKKAAAIVTDEGGITSHAAIVSRELGIPCVVGTKIATKVLKDEDFVEVNANHGVVRKIKMESK